jgi:hypothetical protein
MSDPTLFDILPERTRKAHRQAHYDICRNRHGGDPASEDVNREIENSGAKNRQRARVYAAIVQTGDNGLTCKELAARWAVGMNTISGRFSELLKDGRVRKTDRRRGKSTVIIA